MERRRRYALLRRILFGLTVAFVCLLVTPTSSRGADIVGRSYTCSSMEKYKISRLGKYGVENQGLSLSFDGNGNFRFVDLDDNTYTGTVVHKGSKRFKAIPDQASLDLYQNVLETIAKTQFPVTALTVAKFKWTLRGKVLKDGSLKLRSNAIAKGRATAFGKTRRGTAKARVKLIATEI